MIKSFMNNFIYTNKCEILFGDLPESEIAAALKRHNAKKVLAVYGSGSVKRSGVLDKVLGALRTDGITYIEYGGVVANPLVSHGLEGIKIAKAEKVDFILAIGGGSVIDEAKFIAVGAFGNQDAWELFKSGAEEISGALPVASVLTIPAAGSECSTASVVRDDKTGIKYAIGNEHIRPRFAYINPRYCMTLPPAQVGYGASDIFAHLLERYMSPQTNVTLTDRILEGAMCAMLEIAPKVYQVQIKSCGENVAACESGTPLARRTKNKNEKDKNYDDNDYQVWAEFCLLGTLAHNDTLDMGRAYQDWATHAIDNKLLSGIHNIAHGAGLAIIFPAWMRYVSKTKPDKILQFSREVMGEESIEKGIGKLETWFRSIGLPKTLSEVNIDAESVKEDAKTVFSSATLGDYGQLRINDILAIIESCSGRY